ncbi:TIM-barrel domain-containing protein [Mucilaginibacter sp. R-33]|uniref:glycoside hydrolase family 31 protein n=1 Tax=Mucilaginibacter sp. R-33 TaxID=3416711 RepID=UPI003CF15E81
MIVTYKLKLNTICSAIAFAFVLLTTKTYAQSGNQLTPDTRAVVQLGNARFTVLTDQMIRLQWGELGGYDNRASLVVVNRKLPVPAFTTHNQDNWFYLKTNKIELAYKMNSGAFDSTNLKIRYLNTDTIAWKPGQKQKFNLKGTFRTLDGQDGEMNLYSNQKLQLEDGILSRDGWFLLDDSQSLRLDNSDWPWVTTPGAPKLDWYFLGYGNDYKSALLDFSKIAGRVPMLPRYVFGYWWSRYWSYSDNELRELVQSLKRFDVPTDVLVIDMDWHTKGWTGYTWNKNLFPNPDGFLKWTKENHLKTTLNLHPADGIQPTEERYKDFTSYMKADTSKKQSVPFEASNKAFMRGLFDIVLRPIEKAGVNFWWLDWQQWPNDNKIPQLSNTWWLNYTFFTDKARHGETRPLLYHRWGGLGNHRYQIGFSGDTFMSWESLAYEPYFTSTASNVLYSYWSHDIGGHILKGNEKGVEPELYTRWLQYGGFSPIMRTHSTKNAAIKKEIWNFAPEYATAQHDAIRLRYALVPYIYTMSRKTFETGIGLCRPMYYDYEKQPEAYSYKEEYMFGDNMLIRPVTTPSRDGFATVKVWLPKGNDWYEWHTGTLLKGGQELERSFSINEYPVYIKAGSIIPMYNDQIQNLDKNPNGITLGIFPGDGGKFQIYEDSGNDKNYEGQFAKTNIKSQINGNEQIVNIAPAVGSYQGMAKRKKFTLKLFGTQPPTKILVDGKPLQFNPDSHDGSWNYDGSNLCLNVFLPDQNSRVARQIRIAYNKIPGSLAAAGLVEKFKRLTMITAVLKSTDNGNEGMYIPKNLGIAEETNRLLSYYPINFEKYLKQFETSYKLIPDEIRSLKQIGELERSKFIKLLP